MEGLETKLAWGKLSKVYGERAGGGVCESGGSGGACLRSPGHNILPFASWQSEGMRTTIGEAATKREQGNKKPFSFCPSPEPQPPKRAPAYQWTCTCMMVVMYSGNARPTAATRAPSRYEMAKRRRAVLLHGEDQGNQQSVALHSPRPNHARPTDKNREAKGCRQVPLCVNVPVPKAW